jgi:MFS family permease
MTNYQEYKSNIWKSNLLKFLRQFHLIGAVLVPFFLIWGGISFFQVMILQSFFTFSVFLLEVPTGAIADHLGRKISLAAGSFTAGLAAFTYSLYPNFWLFMFAEFLFALALALISGADQAMVYDSLKEMKKEKTSKKVLGTWNSSGLAALGIAAPVGSLIAVTLGLEWTFRLMAIPMVMAGLLAFTLKEPHTRLKHKKKKYMETLKEGFAYFKNHKQLKLLALDYATIAVLAFFIIWVYQVVLTSLNFPLGYFGWVHAGIVFGEIIVLNNFVRLDRIFRGKKNYLLFSALLTGLGFLTLALVRNIYVAVPTIILIASFGMTRKFLFHNYMNKFIESHHRATVLSTISMLYMFVMAIGNLLWGRLVDWNLHITLGIIGTLIIVLTLISKTNSRNNKY